MVYFNTHLTWLNISNLFILCSYSDGTSTTVLIKHMDHIHGIKISTERNEMNQQRLTDMFISKSRSTMPAKNNSRDERFMLARRLSLWFSRDLLPFSIVEYKGFTDFWNGLGVDIALPTRQTVSIGALDDMYACMKKELISIISTSAGNTKQKSILWLYK